MGLAIVYHPCTRLVFAHARLCGTRKAAGRKHDSPAYAPLQGVVSVRTSPNAAQVRGSRDFVAADSAYLLGKTDANGLLNGQPTSASQCQPATHCPIYTLPVHAAGGLRLLVDLLGPPPEIICQYELRHYSQVLYPGRAEREAKQK